MKKVLLVEDDLQLVRMYQLAFENSGVELLTALDGDDAITKAHDTSPDLILLDIVLPKLDGVQVLEKLKQDQKTKEIPVFMLTVLHQDKDKEKCMSLGAETYLVKTDVSPDAVVEQALQRLGHL